MATEKKTPTSAPTPTPKADPKPTKEESPREPLGGMLRTRANGCRSASRGAFLALFGISILGIVGFVRSGFEAWGEANARSNDALFAVIEDEADLKAMIKFRDDVDDAGAPSKELKEAIERLRHDESLYTSARLGPKTDRELHTSTEYVVSIVSTRVGLAALLIFLSQLFVGIYRYNRRLATFYDARADALLFGDFTDPVAMLAAERIQFGAEPKTPVIPTVGDKS